MVNVKLLRVPCNEPKKFYSTRLQTQYFPPLALGTITSYLRSKGINVDQDDLNIKIRYDNYYTKNIIDTSVFFNKKRIIDYIKGEKDYYLEKITDYCRKDLTQQIKDRSGGEEGEGWVETGTDPNNPDNFSTFLINKDSITFYFPQYQVAAYALGSFEVVMPR